MAVIEIDRSFIGKDFDTSEFTVTEKDILTYAKVCGEEDPRYSDPTHPDFQAPPTITSKYSSRRILPEAFPRLGGNAFDAGKAVTVLGPIRPGDTLTATASIADIYEKTGRSGPMVFIVHRMEFKNQKGEPVSVVDWRLVRQPSKKELDALDKRS